MRQINDEPVARGRGGWTVPNSPQTASQPRVGESRNIRQGLPWISGAVRGTLTAEQGRPRPFYYWSLEAVRAQPAGWSQSPKQEVHPCYIRFIVVGILHR
ncbi:hypothetical protein VTN96DRAFT_4766 [Rasamsonia emersonii]